MNEKLESMWEAARRKIEKVTRPSEQIRAILTRIGAPTTPEEMGWKRPAYQDAIAHAAELRNRYTFLDLARDARLLHPDSR
jgi:glycerol-1-phosphate dehydrogenase [NAD(P)+]